MILDATHRDLYNNESVKLDTIFINDQKMDIFTKLTKIEEKSEGLRYNEGKARYDLIPPEAMEALAQLYAYGTKKYAERNWEKGMSWTSVFASLMRHAWKWLAGKNFDDDPKGSGAHNMIAVAWNAIALYVYFERQVGKDDRPACAPLKEQK